MTTEVCPCLNPASYLLVKEGHEHSCQGVLLDPYTARPDFTDQTLLTDDISSLQGGAREGRVLCWLGLLSCSEKLRVSVCADSGCAYLVLANAATRKEGRISSIWVPRLFEAVQLPCGSHALPETSKGRGPDDLW